MIVPRQISATTHQRSPRIIVISGCPPGARDFARLPDLSSIPDKIGERKAIKQMIQNWQPDNLRA